MRKRTFCLCACVISVLVWGASEPLVRYGFEGETGNGLIEGKVRYESGVQGQAIVLGDSTVTLPCPAGLTPQEGTITLWLKPLNWDSDVKEFVTPLYTCRKAGDGRMMFYKFQKKTGLGLMLWYGNPNVEGHYSYASNYEHEKLEKGKWQFIGMTWSKKNRLMSLNLNGRQIASHRLTDSMIFPDFAPFVLNKYPFDPCNRSYETAFDLLTFYPEALTEGELKKLYEREPKVVQPILPQAVQPTVLSVPKMARPPRIDGSFTAEEWSSATRGGGFTKLNTFELVQDTRSDAYIGCDDRNLYFCCTTKIPQATSLVTRKHKRDGKVYQDDAWEIHLVPPGMKEGGYYQSIFNYGGDIFDRLVGDLSWNGGWTVRNGICEGVWTCELSIPMADFQQRFQQDSRWKFNVCRDLQDDRLARYEFSSLSPALSGFFGTYGEFRMTENDSYGRLAIDYELLARRRLGLVFEAVNQDRSSQPIRVTVQRISAGGKVLATQVMTKDIGAGQAHAFAYEDSLAGFSSGVIRVTATNGKGVVIHRQDVPLLFKDEVLVSLDTRLTQGLLNVDIDMNSHYQLGETASIDAVLRSADGRTQLKHPRLGAMVRCSFDLTSVKPGDCELILVFRDKSGKELLRYAEPYKHIGQPAWLKEKAGEGLGVVPPYTPIRRRGRTLSVWGREHVFGTQLLPEQITSQGVELFSRKPVLRASYDGKRVVFDKVRFQRVKDGEDETVMSFTGQAGKLAIDGTVTLEYDGFLWYEFSLNQPEVTLEELTLEMHLPEQVATFINAHFFDRENYVGKLRLPKTVKQIPSIWLGNTEVGLTMVTESFRHWHNQDPNVAFSFTSRDHGVVWKAHLVDRPTALGKRRLTYAFGLEANPVKPTPKNFRSRRVFSYYNCNVGHPWSVDVSIKKYKGSLGFHTPEHVSMEAFRKEIKRFRDRGMEMSLYLNPYLLTPESTEYKTFLKEWRNPYSTYPMCPASGFTDYTTWQIQEHVRKGDLRCVYVDSLGATNCANPLHGCGYRDEQGNQKLTWPIRGIRNYMKRIYSLIHAPGHDSPNNHVWAHMSARTSAPIDAFVDFQCSGEELETKIMTNSNYLELYGMDEFQVYYNKSSGVTPTLLPNLGRYGPKPNRYMSKYNDQLVALALLHDVLIWVSWCDETYVNNLYRLVDAFGYMDPCLRFHSYRSQKMVATSTPLVYISVYTLGKKAMAVIVNKNKTEQELTLDLDLELMGVPQPASLLDMRAKKSLPGGRTVKLTVPGYNFKLLQIGQ